MKKLCLLALLLLCAPILQAQPPNPLLWKISDKNNRVYLLGSFHLLKASDYPLASSVQKAFDAAGKVYFEVSPEAMRNPELAGKLMLQRGMFSGDKTLQQSLKPATWKQFVNYCTARNMSPENFQKFEPWFLTLVLSLAEMQKAGLQPEFGLDRYFAERAKTVGKNTGGLETPEQQVALLDGMNAEEQEQSLSQILAESEHMQQDLEELHRLWRNGDADHLWQFSKQQMAQSPQFYRRVFVARNKAWLPKIAALLQDATQNTVLVVVGSMHLLGEDGLVSLLKKQGYQVNRVASQ
ncbi:MAG: TraB/GumN family protein [Gammaproteobacteria bacterium]